MKSLKQPLLGSLAGRVALSIRGRVEILHAASFRPDDIGTIANDQIATRLVTRLCKSNKIFIDVGAHIGSTISEVEQIDPSVRLVAIEAMQEKVATLRRKFPSAEIHGCAVGESTGEVLFFINNRLTGFSSLGRPVNADERTISEVRVPIKKLDELVSFNENDVDVIKIDVEGAELGVFRGCPNLLRSSRPVIMFESGPQVDDGLGYTKEALFEFLASNNFAVLIPNRVAHNDPGLTRESFLESHLYPRRTTNYFAVPIERRVEIRDRSREVLRTPVGRRRSIVWGREDGRNGWPVSR